MKKARLNVVILLIFFTICAMLCIIYKTIFYKEKALLTNTSLDSPIQLNDNSQIHFFKSGFAVSDHNTRFYSFDGKEISLPFTPQDMEFLGSSPVVTRSTPKYFLVNDRFIYNTSNTPFAMVYEIGTEYEGWDMRELDNMLLLVVKTTDNRLKPLLFRKGDSYAVNLDIIEYSHYLDASYYPSTEGLSVLTLVIDTPYPSTRVFHFASGSSPYGILSLNNNIFYKLYRTENTIVLVGIHQLMCYNIDGSFKWSINSPNCYIHQYVNLNNSLLLYFPETRINKANTLYVYDNGEKNLLEFPYGLTSLQAFKNQQLIALNKNNELVIINKNGNIVKRYALDIYPTKVYWTPFALNYVYIIDSNNLLHIYALSKSNK